MRRTTLPLIASFLGVALNAQAYVLLGGKWPTEDGPVEYHVSSRGSDDIPDDSDTRAVEYSFRSWECVLCGDVQFRNVGDGPNEVARDGINAVFWLETAAEWQSQTGSSLQSTLGVTFHHDTATYSEADIAFNGAGHDWSTNENFSATDVESVSVHETGHFAGLGHPCTDPSESDCLGPNESVMTPAYPGGDARALLDDDKNGLCAVYTTPKSQCSGFKRLKETCEKDCECEPGLLCVPDGATRMCSRSCGTDRPACPKGTGCALGADGAGNVGVCLRNQEEGRLIDGAVCTRDQECSSASCTRSPTLNKLVCVRSCANDGQCATGYVCRENVCLLPTAGGGVPCPKEDEKPSCLGCGLSGPDGAVWVALAVLLARRRRGILPRS